MSQQYTIGKTATKVNVVNSMTTVRYHQTDIVKFDDRSITLDNGGWMTATTKTRMNQASNQFNLGYHVYQKDCSWFVEYQGMTFTFDNIRLVLSRR